ncbi:MAG TPA: prolipoprotein diacylglyceryl transferase family protein, partial [Steroidobacteraceae bacterium]|nr:prolipoprotein diacylglyceryl transferase family protein [Steroidobacteraceae bacterium]
MLRYPGFDPIALRIGPLRVHWYGIMYLLGFAAGWLLARRRA